MVNDSESTVVVVAHPAERRRGHQAAPALAGPCCCCCCCLHSIGGIIGAALGPHVGGGGRGDMRPSVDGLYDAEDRMGARGLTANEREHITEKPFSAIAPSESVLREYLRPKEIDLPSCGPSAVRMFWVTFFVVNVISVFIAGISGTEAMAAVVFILLFMPGFQLGSAALVAFILALSFRPDKSYQLRKLAMIVLGAVVGAIMGILAMVGLFFAFNPTSLDMQAAGWSLVGSVVAGVALAGLLALSRPSGK